MKGFVNAKDFYLCVVLDRDHIFLTLWNILQWDSTPSLCAPVHVHQWGWEQTNSAWLRRRSQSFVSSQQSSSTFRVFFPFSSIHWSWGKAQIFKEKFLVNGKKTLIKQRKLKMKGNHSSPSWWRSVLAWIWQLFLVTPQWGLIFHVPWELNSQSSPGKRLTMRRLQRLGCCLRGWGGKEWGLQVLWTPTPSPRNRSFLSATAGTG